MIRLAWCLMILLPTALWPPALAAQSPPDGRRRAADHPSAIWRALFARPAAARTDDATQNARVALGRRLFADARLSGDGQRSCATCHQPIRSFTDGLMTASGISGSPLKRNTPALWNLATAKSFYWDGRAATLADQARVPIEAAEEMAGHWPTTIGRLSSDPAMRPAFAAAFPANPQVSEHNILSAIAAYEAALVSPPTRFDDWIGGDAAALTKQEQTGFRLFVGKAGCVQCHVGWRFTDDRFHDIGLASADPGRGAISGGVPGLQAFKTPGLREIGRTAPYMHDGSKATLADVLAHYAGGFVDRPGLSSNMKRSLRLDEGERQALLAFLATLTLDTLPAGP